MGMDLKRTELQRQVLQLVRDAGLRGISGYEIYQRLGLGSGHIYAMLAKFERVGALRRLAPVSNSTVGKRAPARPYVLEELGRAMLEDWVSRR